MQAAREFAVAIGRDPAEVDRLRKLVAGMRKAAGGWNTDALLLRTGSERELRTDSLRMGCSMEMGCSMGCDMGGRDTLVTTTLLPTPSLGGISSANQTAPALAPAPTPAPPAEHVTRTGRRSGFLRSTAMAVNFGLLYGPFNASAAIQRSHSATMREGGPPATASPPANTSSIPSPDYATSSADPNPEPVAPKKTLWERLLDD